MLKYSKISKYKVKKILECFAKDYTSTKTSELVNLSRNTVDRYYSIFRKIIKQILHSLIKEHYQSSQYIGYVKQEYGPKKFTKVYKISSTLFFPVFSDEKPEGQETPPKDDDFYLLSFFLLRRLAKFRGFSLQNYHLQIFETALKFHYTAEELYNLIWEYVALRSDKRRRVGGFTQSQNKKSLKR